MKIGHVKIKTPIFLAPMAGYTDYPFRILCKQMGAGVVYSEFVSSDGIIRENAKSLDLIRFSEKERPIGIQIFGDDPDVMAMAARTIVDQFAPDILDINYGCPVPKVTKKGAGSAALKDLCLMEEITSAVVESVPEVPVTVKMRSGWDKNSIVVPEVGPRLEKIGVKAIALHPRTTSMRYNGQSNWALIRQLKESVSIPVIGNGDIKTSDDMMRMFDETNCDAVMIGRAAHGNPWFFREAKAQLNGETVPSRPSLLEIAEMCERHLDLIIKYHGPSIGSKLIRKHFSSYVKRFPGASKIRYNLVTAPGLEEMRDELARFKTRAEAVDEVSLIS
ncbi:MAG: tRNA dihydrouridine synthase DusB [Candidatus Marinimicrobia bacterium]|nr:tRNA dihydrouridine synthase DusB [Candidatus Neomarinimicrobiota bacterium]MBT3496737.1 tRNA dihydrouridine synthase DusB [Candidatus Neomarinimicrobiota bacterium]MBT3692717.1 tRNA dihydrouridine synthase DusB [Candidatus Neomarinimicrobiota bacterium]MBT3732871.1 tRNA dihydrouridine synthase DusB [Candidatus Neomarinimicrobiota bacterium]MBT4144746.1 tRNA dihydrouridine synthase DusB [Candidatus Neomarinimicrobiota bacterium]